MTNLKKQVSVDVIALGISPNGLTDGCAHTRDLDYKLGSHEFARISQRNMRVKIASIEVGSGK